MDHIKTRIGEFLEKLNNKEIEIYNEFSLQHELGIWLRCAGYKVQFERNISYFSGCFDKDKMIKKEIDIIITNENNEKLACIELKYPRNGEFPNQMFSFCKDIKFLEQLCSSDGFQKGFFLVIVDFESKGFYKGKCSDDMNPIYQYFRQEKDNTVLHGPIMYRGTIEQKDPISLNGNYKVQWNDLNDIKLKFCLLPINEN
jgi:hypothetical protein